MAVLHVAFIVPFFLPTTLRFVLGTARLENVRLSLISQDPLEKLPADLRARLVGHWRVADALNGAELAAALRELSQRHGAVDRAIASLEQLQVPLAEAARWQYRDLRDRCTPAGRAVHDADFLRARHRFLRGVATLDGLR